MFDPSFYREALERSRWRVVMFTVKLLFFTAMILGMSRAYYLVHSERGIAPLVSAMFVGMEIRDGLLTTEHPQPYEVSGEMLTALLNRLMGHSRFFERVPDNFLVVDTRGTRPDPGAAGAPKIIMGESTVMFADMRMEMPYKSFVSGGNFQFTVSSIQEFLNRNALTFTAHFFITGLFMNFFTVMMGVLFLSLAAFVFRADRAKCYQHFLRLACFAISPVALGAALVSISGVSAEWTWHVFIILSTLIMFRAMVNTADKPPDEKKEAI